MKRGSLTDKILVIASGTSLKAKLTFTNCGSANFAITVRQASVSARK
jgi:hypothetical protein